MPWGASSLTIFNSQDKNLVRRKGREQVFQECNVWHFQVTFIHLKKTTASFPALTAVCFMCRLLPS